MPRLLIALLCLISITANANEGLVNTQKAAKELFGIEVEHKFIKASIQKTPILVTYDFSKITGDFSVVVRNKNSKEVGKFKLKKISKWENMKKGMARVEFQLHPEYLRQSYLASGNIILPLRLFFKPNGFLIENPVSTNQKPTSEYFKKFWSIHPADLNDAIYAKADKNIKDPFGVKGLSQEDMVRSWGLIPPEGTVFIYSLNKSGMMVRSTEAFLDQLEGELIKRDLFVKQNK